MKLLQVPTANLEERIKEEMEENPALEQEEENHDEFEEQKMNLQRTAKKILKNQMAVKMNMKI